MVKVLTPIFLVALIRFSTAVFKKPIPSKNVLDAVKIILLSLNHRVHILHDDTKCGRISAAYPSTLVVSQKSLVWLCYNANSCFFSGNIVFT